MCTYANRRSVNTPLANGSRVCNTIRTVKEETTMMINGKETERFVNFTDAVKRVMAKRNCTNQEATHFVWDNQFTVGTDKAIWITL